MPTCRTEVGADPWAGHRSSGISTGDFRRSLDGEEATFSDIVRFALRNFVEKGGATSGLSNVVVTFGRVPMLIQVRGQHAEVPAHRRTPLIDERIPPALIEIPVTTAST